MDDFGDNKLADVLYEVGMFWFQGNSDYASIN